MNTYSGLDVHKSLQSSANKSIRKVIKAIISGERNSVKNRCLGGGYIL
ncbi:MAG: hypothetical protein LBD76_02525 [Prevotellaceae bacterium]|jgi:hypothetical protein|nr:hypothetical protein [Prevotellaceae bacterium]